MSGPTPDFVLEGAAWLEDPAAAAVLDALEAAGGPDCVRFVGGCVRNAVMGRAVADVDLATRLEPPAVVAALDAAGLKAVPTGLDHGTITAVSGGRGFEITTLRRDVETDGRRAIVAFTSDWAEDAARRDFTLNALYADRRGRVFDPTGQGLAAAREGRIAFVGEADRRIAEDHLRILRYFRFLARYGRGEPDPAAAAACAGQAGSLTSLPAERVLKELLSLLEAADPRPSVRLMAATGVLAHVLPHAGDLSRFEGLFEVEILEGSGPDALLRLGALFPETPAEVAREAERLRLSGAQRDRLIAAAGREPRLASWASPREQRRVMHLLGAAVTLDRLRLAWSRAPHSPAARDWREQIALAQAWTPRTLGLSGADVVAAGARPGPLVGEALRELEAWWMDEDFPDDAAALRERLAAILRGLET
ncbi:CCA tRNA nucleotidyltransferase [Phenylobacterium sp.]|uniref:CCA tRNA nucleotidyltransferase n=1 Tax=Phenylobacterium sp. TaxID=1871053 RepID=UPI0025CFA6C5|nr:CCA tRNA nucleotidyltransferase [Phenylobacterium sp.]